MKNYKDICYKTNLLHQVIIRVDFIDFYKTEEIFTEIVETAILKHFPNKGKLQILRFNTLIEHIESDNSTPGHSINQQEGKQKEYMSKDNQNKAILSNKFLIFEINKYQNYEQVSDYLNDILSALFSQKELRTNRVGIRYINILDSQKIKIYQKYFVPEVASALKTKELDDSAQIKAVRSMHISEYTVSGMNLNFRYGLYNPQYPNPLADRSFSLDYDCYTGDVFDTKDSVMKAIDKGHNYIQILFESTITDALREVMNNE